MSSSKKRWACAAIAVGLLGVSAAFLLRFSYSTSFLWPGYCGYDSAIFQTIGKYWAQGSVPYRDLFDHKGPLIFFIDMLGYWLHGRAGILVPQTVSLAATLFFLYKLGRVYLPRPGAVLAAGVALVYLARTFDEGNMTEEYALPFLAASLWLAAGWCEGLKKDPDAPHPWRHAAVYGLSFGAILMLRVTSAVSICCFVLVITLHTLFKKQWAALAKNAAAFLGGFAAVTVPFCVYFAFYGALGQMLYGTIGYNLLYATEFSLTDYYGGSPWASATFRRTVLDFGAPVLLLAVLALLCILRAPRRPLGWAALLTAGLNMYLLFSNRPYLHYFMIAAPLVPLALGMAWKLWAEDKAAAKRAAGWLALVLAGAYLVSLAARLPGWQRDSFMARYPNETADYNNIARSMAAVIPAGERDSVLAWEVDAQWYLATDIRPCQNYFIHQEWQSAADPEMAAEQAARLEADPPAWLVVGNVTNADVADLIAREYTAVSSRAEFYEFSGYTLYRHNG